MVKKKSKPKAESMATDATPEKVDVLVGMSAIAAFMGVRYQTIKNQVYANPSFPTFKMFGKVCARRSTLNAWIAAAEAAAMGGR